jgi:broad specificity phosphatase PhoE
MKILCCNPAWSHAVLPGDCCYDFQAEALSSHQVHCRYDTRLTEEGKAQAVLARVDAKALSPKPEVLITSPLTRALHTAQLAFGESLGCPTVVEPTCSERIWLSSDVGRQPNELQQDFPTVDLDSLEDVWWHNNGSGDVQHILAETPGAAHCSMLAQTWLHQHAFCYLLAESHAV